MKQKNKRLIKIEEEQEDTFKAIHYLTKKVNKFMRGLKHGGRKKSSGRAK